MWTLIYDYIHKHIHNCFFYVQMCRLEYYAEGLEDEEVSHDGLVNNEA